MRHLDRILIIIVYIFFSETSMAGRIRLRKVPEAPRTCTVMKEEPFLSRTDKKILGTEKNSIIIDEQISLVDDLGQKQCVWPVETFSALGDAKKMNFYIDEYKNLLVAYEKNDILNNASTNTQNAVQQVQINTDNCQLDQIKTLSQVQLPECHPPKKIKNKKRKTNKKNKKK